MRYEGGVCREHPGDAFMAAAAILRIVTQAARFWNKRNYEGTKLALCFVPAVGIWAGHCNDTEDVKVTLSGAVLGQAILQRPG